MQPSDPLNYTEADVQAILASRARELAQPPPKTRSDDTFQAVIFSLANERYALEVHHVLEILQLERITPVPCTPDFVAGIINVRGHLFSVVDIRKFFDVPEGALTHPIKVILVNAAGLEVGLLADDVTEVADLSRADLEPPLATHQGIRQKYIQGLTDDPSALPSVAGQAMLVVLDAEALLRDPRMIVNEEVT